MTKATSARYCAAHREEILTQKRVYNEAHREQRKAYMKQYGAAHGYSTWSSKRKAQQKKGRRRRYRDPIKGAAMREGIRQAAWRSIRIKRDLIAVFRSGGCVVCGEKDPACLDAHHMNPATKLFGIGVLKTKTCSPTTLRDELAKCVCLCSNCHRKLHRRDF